MPITSENYKEAFTYHSPTPEQVGKLKAINDAAENLAKVILENTKICGDQQAAVRLVREARMTANAAVVLDGQF